MADFGFVKEQGVWINLDYVVRIERNVDEAESTAVFFADGTSFTISRAYGKRHVQQILPKRKKKKKKKKKKKEAVASEAAGVEEPPAAPVDL